MGEGEHKPGTELMTITVNGKPKEIDAPATVAALLESLKLDAARVALELNREILPRAEFADRTLANGDTLEIVQFVGGG
jgi:thiamine biosynthesis protein ThiS